MQDAARTPRALLVVDAAFLTHWTSDWALGRSLEEGVLDRCSLFCTFGGWEIAAVLERLTAFFSCEAILRS